MLKRNKLIIRIFIVAFAIILTGKIVINNIVRKNNISYATQEFSIDKDIKEQYKLLLKFKFDRYEEMSILELRNKIYDVIKQDEGKYLPILDSILYDNRLEEMRYYDQNAFFIKNILVPIISEKWSTGYFSGYVTEDTSMIEYSVSYQINNANNLKVKDFIELYLDTKHFFEDSLNNKARIENNELKDEYIKELTSEFNDDLNVKIDYVYRDDYNGVDNSNIKDVFDDDCSLLLSLKTDDYKDMTVKDFNNLIWDAFNTNDTYKNAWERVSKKSRSNTKDFKLEKQDSDFFSLTLAASLSEKVAIYQQKYTDETLYPSLRFEISKGDYVVDYEISYTLKDKTKITVLQRDEKLQSVVTGMKEFLNNIDEKLDKGEKLIREECEKLTANASDDDMTIKIKCLYWHQYDATWEK